MANLKTMDTLPTLVKLIALLLLSTLPSLCISAVALPKLAVPNSFGTNIHFRGEPRDLDLIAEAGFKFIRMDLSWGGVERKKGIYDFDRTGYDALTAGCTKRGIRLLYILDYSNKLYESERSVRTDPGRRAFAAFAEAAAERYKGKGILWEIWNEPNIKQFWSPQPSVDDYCKLVELTAPLVRKADPTGLVVAPATSGMPFKWLEDCFKKGLFNWIDVLSVHPYRPHPPETVIKDYAKLRELIKRYAPKEKNIPIISGEWGYSNVNWDKRPLTNEQQAQYLARMLLINMCQGIPVSIWYDWKNDGTNPDEREHNFGTVTHDLKPKAAYLVARTLSETLAGYSIDKRIDLQSENDFAFLLKKGGRRAIAVWTIAAGHETVLPLGRTEIKLIDYLGRENSKEKWAWQSNGLKLTISQSPQYVLITRN